MNFIKYCLLVMSLLLPAGSLFGQDYIRIHQADKKANKCFDKAEKALDKKDYKEAIKHYNNVLKRDDRVIDAILKLGTSHLAAGNKSVAIPYLEQVAKLDPSFEPKVLYTLYKLYEEDSNYEQASSYLEKYRGLLNPEDKRWDKVQRELSLAQFRDSLVSHPVDFNPVPLDQNINSDLSEYLPAITADGETLIFTRRDSRQEDFYESKMDSITYSKALPIASLNTNANEGAHCISQDGSLIIFTACDRPDSKGGCDLYYAVKSNDSWSKVKNMGSMINSEAWDAQPSLSPNGKTLYFSTKRKGGKGAKDIWVSELVDRRWQSPKPVAGKINTPGNEASPFIHPDNHTLYFRSDEHQGMGSFDIFYAKKGMEGFESVHNMGYPINTKANDGALFVNLEGSQAYFATDKDKDNLDIYTFEIPNYAKPDPVSFVKFRVSDYLSKAPLQASLLVVDIESQDTILNQRANSSGVILTSLVSDRSYALYVEKQDYLFYSERIQFEEGTAFEPIDKTVLLQRIPEIEEIDEAKPIVLRNVFFNSGSAELLEKSFAEIDKLTQLLNENLTMRIKIIGHTDHTGEEQRNVELSTERANAVKNAVVRNGVSASRIVTEGRGEYDPVDTNDTREGRANNRRTEFIIIR